MKIENQGSESQNSCSVTLSNNIFVNNRAFNKGGAIMWTNKNFTQGELPNKFVNNSAPYGAAQGSFPNYLGLDIIENYQVHKIDQSKIHNFGLCDTEITN